jgi:hypothetical protein
VEEDAATELGGGSTAVEVAVIKVVEEDLIEVTVAVLVVEKKAVTEPGGVSTAVEVVVTKAIRL